MTLIPMAMVSHCLVTSDKFKYSVYTRVDDA